MEGSKSDGPSRKKRRLSNSSNTRSLKKQKLNAQVSETDGAKNESDALRYDDVLPMAIPGDTPLLDVRLPVSWKEMRLHEAVCLINGEEVTFQALLQNYRISPVDTPQEFVFYYTPQPAYAYWRDRRKKGLLQLLDLVARSFPDVVTARDLTSIRRVLTPIEDAVLKAELPNSTVGDTSEWLPDLTALGSWRSGEQSELTNSSLEQDFTVEVYAQYFSPFFRGLDCSNCAPMPLPPPFENYIRKPEARAFVKSALGDFTFFIREDSQTDPDSDPSPHKDLFKLVQLIRCALQLQVLMLRPDNNRRTLYCFGTLSRGYELLLLQMTVELNDAYSYKSPDVFLYIDSMPIDLDCSKMWVELSESEKLSDNEEQKSEKHTRSMPNLTRLFNWLSVIRSYGFHLKRMLDSTWKLNPQLLPQLQTAKKISVAGSSDKTSLSDSEGDKKSSDHMNDAILTAVIDAIECKRYHVLHERGNDKKVVAICTYVDRIRLFAVKIFGPKAQQVTREVEVMKMLGPHPHLSEILATTTLKTGELAVIQPYYRSKGTDLFLDDYFNCFLQLAKALEYLHERGVIHGDIKPDNFIIESGPHVRLIDFDFSLRIGVDGIDQYCGTPGYRPPEIRNKSFEITAKVDIWSLAMTLMASLAPFGEEKDSLKRRQIVLSYLASSNCQCVPYRALVTKMLEINPRDRPTARQVRESMELARDNTHIIYQQNAAASSKENETANKKRMRRTDKTRSALKDISNLV